MKSFDFSNETKIIFGAGSEDKVGAETKKYSDNILIVCTRAVPVLSALADRVEKSLQESGVACSELTGVKPNPDISKVYEGIEIVHRKGIGLILAIGGGSFIDTAKGIAAGALYDGDAWDLYLRQRVEKALPTGVVLTLPAAGSESSLASVMSNGKTNYKMDILGLCLRPRFAVLNPELTLSLPDFQTFSGVTDMLSHVMERYFGNDIDNDFTDRMCEGTMKSIIRNALILKDENISSLTARSEIMWAGTIAHNGLLETGREMDWASHGMGMEISAIYDTTHGATLSVITPHWARYVYRDNIPKFAQFANRVFDVEYDAYAPERTALKGIQKLEEFLGHIGMPLTMRDIGIETDERFDEMARKATRNGPIGGVRRLDVQDICAILRSALR